MPRRHLQDLPENHLGRVRPARRPGDAGRPGRPTLPRTRHRDTRQTLVSAPAVPPPLTADRLIGAVPLAYPPRYALGCGPTVPAPLLHPAPLRTTYIPTRIEGVKIA